jgi:tRNA G18 (ribose-2'-O)-methylase SpoU
VIVQFLLAFLLPQYIHSYKNPIDEMEIHFLTRTLHFLSENKECKKMFRRQVKQFDQFEPEKNCTLDGILTNAFLSEYQDLFPTKNINFTSQFKETMNEIYANFQLQHFPCQKKKLENLSPSTNQNTPKTNTTFSLDNFQRKIETNTSFKLNQTELLLFSSSLPTQRRQQCHQVILCASLVEKLPNVAGLARTCEIFQVSSLWIGNLRMCQEEMFENISVTANKWVQMDEIKEENLFDQLMFFKEKKGFTIVGLEQTATSQCLSNFKFPEKMIFVWKFHNLESFDR